MERKWSLGDDRGAASVFAVAVAGVWFGLAAVGVRFGEEVVVRHRLAAAADLGALAAAAHLVDGVAVGCAKAGVVVGRMGGRLVRCDVAGWEVVVEVEGGPSLFGAPSARARAGPTEG
ncbi:Rv3654c family TadE-like protein [Saccharothrix syringae]|uniref:Pilus assembly protein TadE n=1 Tax=Saccharothrix syringae TaxID=103733 RepID=A0A5Q0GRK5_SACSY|nr:Rv3654c family TadE-like protein [Saccharothrix syringae]QFZ16315.1 pilus assembly protein TadE [Saccharothrix syringae]